MENDAARKDQGETRDELLPVTPKKRTRKERSKSNESSQKSGNNKKHSLWRNFREQPRTRQMELCFFGLAAIGGVGYLFAYICVSVSQSHQIAWNFKTEHRPKLIFSRPPQFVTNPSAQEIPGVLACKSSDHEVRLQTGTFHVWVKNIGNEDASGAFIAPNVKLVPEQKTGEALFDDPPSIGVATCNNPSKPLTALFPVYRGREVEMPVRQVAEAYALRQEVTIPEGTKFDLYAVLCADYSDSEGAPYASCATYRLLVKGEEGSLNPFAISCDGSSITGAFQPTFAGYCEN